MAKTTAPLLSWAANGTIAKTQVYSEWKGRPYVRRYVVPANPRTAGQQLTRNTFSFLTQLWKYMPAGATAAWDLYADNSQITARNAWIKQNLGPLRSETDLGNLLLSVAAGSGIVATSVTPTPGSNQISIALVPPPLPVGWTVSTAWGMAVLDVDPQTSSDYEVHADSDDSDPYTVVLTGLTASVQYIAGGWFIYTKPDGSLAYGPSLQSPATPTA